ncbi:MAG: hypothetical protein COB08_019340 [Rhodobacteraceae bacterium]|nr:hypothetical protein [Paracoccaceae bacterium]
MTQFSLVDIGYGTKIRIGRGGGPAWTNIMGAEKASVPSQPPEDIDVTHFDSPDRTRETMPGMKAVADYGLELQYWTGSPTDLLLQELSDLTGAGTRELVLLEITPNGGTTVMYQCYVNEYVPSMSVGEKQMVAASFKVMGRIITAAAPTSSLLPSISGIAQVGQTLTAMVGAWTEAPTFTYQWQEDAGAGFVDIGGETGATTVVVVGSIGFPIQVVVTGTNTEGTASVTSGSSSDVVA